MASTTAIRAGRAFVELFADDSRLVRGLREAETRVKDFGAKMQALGMKLSTIGVMAAIPLGIATKVFADFDDQMRAVSAVTNATEAEFESLTDKAKALGRTTSYTAAQVAGAMLELGRAGFDPTEIDAAIAGMLDLARATGTDLAEATIYAGNTLRSFNLPATETTRVCDVLVATANNSAQTLTDLGESMSYCAPIAAEYGLSLEQTAKALGSLANYGVKGSQAGTTLRRILTNLADPAIQKRLSELKIDVVDGNTGELRDVSAILRELGRATESMSKDKKLGLFKELFGLYAIAGGAKLTTASFDKLYDAVDNATGKIREFSNFEIQNVKIELQKTGFNAKEIDDVTNAVLDLTKATGSDLATATVSTTTLLNAFGLSANQAGRVVDVLAATANASGKSLDEIGTAMQTVAPIAAAFGLSLEETAKAFGVFAASGMETGKIGRTLQTTLNKLADPNLRKKLSDLKIDIVEPETRKLKDLPKLLQDVGNATADMPTSKRRDLLKEIFGDSLVNGAGLTQKQLESLSGTIDFSQGLASKQAKEGGLGAAEKTAKRMDSGIGGSFRMLLSAVEGVAVAVGDALAPAIQKVAGYFTKASEGVASYIDKNKELIVAIAKVVASVVGIGVALLSGSVAVLAFAKTIGLVAGSISILSKIALTGFGLIVGAIRAVTIVVGGLLSAFGAIATALSASFAAVSAVATALFSAVGTAITAILSPVGLTLVAIAALGGACYLVYQNAAEIGRAFSKAFSFVAGSIKNAANSVGRFLMQFAKLKIVAGLSKIIGSELNALGTVLLWVGRQAYQTFAAVGGAIVNTFFSVVRTIPNVVANVVRAFAAFPGTLFKIFQRIPTMLSGIFSSLYGIAKSGVGGIGNVLSNVAGFVTSAWSGVLSSFTTLFNSLGVIVANFGNFFVTAFANLGAAVDWLKTQFGNFVAFASETFGAVAKAVGRGDIEAALQVVWASLKLIWVKGSTSLLETWYWVVDTLQSAWATCVYSLSELLISSWSGVQEFWTESVYTMSALWAEFSSGVVDAWKKAEESIAKGIGWIMAKMQGLDPNEMNQILTEQYDRQSQQREAQKTQSLSEIQKTRDSKMNAIGTEKQGVIETLNVDRQRSSEARNQSYQSKIAGQEAELQTAQTEYDAAITQAKTPPEVKPEGENGTGSVLDSITAQVQNVVKGFQANVESSEKISVTGSFSAAALRNMGTSSTMDRVAKATEKSEKHLDKIANRDEQSETAKKAKQPEKEEGKEDLATTELKAQTRLLRDIASGAMHFA